MDASADLLPEVTMLEEDPKSLELVNLTSSARKRKLVPPVQVKYINTSTEEEEEDHLVVNSDLSVSS